MHPPLDLEEIRKEQRRLAAILRRKYTHVLTLTYRKRVCAHDFAHWCSRLDPEGHHRNPALDYLRQGLINVGRYHGKEEGAMDFRRKHQNAKPDKGWKTERHTGPTRPRPFMTGSRTHRESQDEVRREKSKSLDEAAIRDLHLPHISQTNRVSSWLRQTPVDKKRRVGMWLEETESGDTHMHVGLPDMNDAASLQTALSATLRDETTTLPRMGSQEAILRYQHGMLHKGQQISEEEFYRMWSASYRDREKTLHILGQGSDIEKCVCDNPGVEPGLLARQCSQCHLTGGHQPWCSEKALFTSLRCTQCGKFLMLENMFGSETSFIKKSRFQTSNASLLSGKGHTNFSRESSGDFYRVRSPTDDSINMGEIRKALKERGESVLPSLPTPKPHKKKQNSPLFENQNTSDIMTQMEQLDEKLQSGAFDFDTDLDVKTIDTRLHFEAEQPESQDDDTRRKLTSHESKIGIYPDGARQAYIRALAEAQIKNMPSDPWLLHNRISRAFVFSYFNHEEGKCRCPRCQARNKLQKKVGKRKPVSEMRHIFGDVNVNDHYPGGKKNPLVRYQIRLPPLKKAPAIQSKPIALKPVDSIRLPMVREESDHHRHTPGSNTKHASPVKIGIGTSGYLNGTAT